MLHDLIAVGDVMLDGALPAPVPAAASMDGSSCMPAVPRRTRRSQPRDSVRGRPSSAVSAHDAAGRLIADELAAAGVEVLLARDDGGAHRMRVVVGASSIVSDPGASARLAPDDLPKTLEAGAVLVSGYSLLQTGPEAAARAALERAQTGWLAVDAASASLVAASASSASSKRRRSRRGAGERRGGAGADRPGWRSRGARARGAVPRRVRQARERRRARSDRRRRVTRRCGRSSGRTRSARATRSPAGSSSPSRLERTCLGRSEPDAMRPRPYWNHGRSGSLRARQGSPRLERASSFAYDGAAIGYGDFSFHGRRVLNPAAASARPGALPEGARLAPSRDSRGVSPP